MVPMGSPVVPRSGRPSTRWPNWWTSRMRVSQTTSQCRRTRSSPLLSRRPWNWSWKAKRRPMATQSTPCMNSARRSRVTLPWWQRCENRCEMWEKHKANNYLNLNCGIRCSLAEARTEIAGMGRLVWPPFVWGFARFCSFLGTRTISRSIYRSYTVCGIALLLSKA